MAFLLLFYFCFFASVDQGVCQEPENTSNAYAAPLPVSNLKRSGAGKTIVPYSQFMQKQAEEHRRLFNKTQPQTYTSSATSHSTQEEEDGSKPLVIYLPAFSNAGASFISDKEVDEQEKSIFSTKKAFWKGTPTTKNPIRPQIRQESNIIQVSSNPDEYGSQTFSNVRKSVTSQPDSRLTSSATYSTNSNREPIPSKQSIFRPRISNTLSPKTMPTTLCPHTPLLVRSTLLLKTR